MVAPREKHEIVRLAKEWYERCLRATLEAEHRDEFVAIEPISQTYFLGKTLSEVGKLARRACPGKIAYALRIGHPAAVQIGGFEA